LIFVYYLLLTAGEAMAEKGILPALVALWIPNVVFAALGVVLFVAAAREHSLNPFAPLWRYLPQRRTAGANP
jgi:hypothetical protein